MLRKGLALTCLLTAIVDQGTKYLVRLRFSIGESRPVIPGILHLTYIRNPGIAFGLAAGWSWAVLVVSGIMLAFLILRAPRIFYRDPASLFGLGLVAGGTVGNVVDRLRFGEVVDFIDLRVWPVFNVADVAIVCGAALVAVRMAGGRGLLGDGDRAGGG